MFKNCVRILVGCAALSVASRAEAAPIIYTFEVPQFTVGQTTPLLNVAPNIGDPTFDTDFTASNELFLIIGAPLNTLFSGQNLQDPTGVPDTLTLVFSSPITSLQVDFALNLATTAVGRLDLTSPVGSTSAAAANVGGFPGGTLFFSSVVPFSTVQLSGFASGSTRTHFAIDDLTLDTAQVPEPASMLLFATGLLGAGVRRWRQRRG